jgi:hypothetical protein
MDLMRGMGACLHHMTMAVAAHVDQKFSLIRKLILCTRHYGIRWKG